ncbi:MAG: TolC family outer membrane protein [Gammaproteobacteria bacterium]|nr:TolC family outer membrane protein [Gammaproteobacteria bacterium]
MKKQFYFLFFISTLLTFGSPAFAIDLLQVYQQALQNDPTYKAAEAQQMVEVEAVPQSIALLLPQLALEGSAGLSRTDKRGNIETYPPTTRETVKQRGVGYSLDLQQSIFNFPNWQKLAAAQDSVKAANATYNAAVQDLMNRAVQAYFGVLQAQEILKYTQAEKRAIYEEYIRANQSFKVGLNTITDVYNAKAAYDETLAAYVAAQNDLENKKEDLRAITNQLYQQFSELKDFTPAPPSPADIEKWVTKSASQNWQLVAARYNTMAAHKQIAEAQGGHLPALGLEAKYGNQYNRTFGQGNERDKTLSADMQVTMPIFSGGGITSKVRQAMANYELVSQEQEKTYRDVMNTARKSYLGVMSSISKIQADKQAIISNQSSLEGTKEGYKVGTRTMVDVLNAQRALYEAQKNYAIDRYQYIFSSIALKEAAGTLNVNDLKIVNNWLQEHIAIKNKRTALPPKVVQKNNIKKQDEIFLQIGAYRSQTNARKASKVAESLTHSPVKIIKSTSKNRSLYSVLVRATNQKQASEFSQKLQKAGFGKPFLVR